MEAMPPRLRQIREEVNARRSIQSNLRALQSTWDAHVKRVREQVPDAHVEAEGEIVYLGELSPGCRACKQGTWDCIFVTMRCNLDCRFCYSPHSIPQDYAGSAFGGTAEQIAGNYEKTSITGISFSGGEPFLDAKNLFEWVTWFKTRFPERYYWVYTNGLLADAASLRRLGELGLDEIRFNAAATGYDHPTVMEHVRAASDHIPNVTIEIPAIPGDAPKLLACLSTWCALGARFLNLHELMYEPGTHSASMPGRRQAVVTADGHDSAIHPESRALTLAVMQRVQNLGLPLSVNDCSLQSKLRQLRGRRRSLAPLNLAPHERQVDDHSYESYCAYRGEQEQEFLSPQPLGQIRRRYPEHQFVRLARMAPLSIDAPETWIAFEKLGSSDA
jgi:pyruvate formate-lyase activating enzyme-like uncharacterized protein